MRAYKTVNDSYIEPISFTVPRRAENFQADIYPPATGLRPAMSAKEWLEGKDGVPPKIDLESIYEGNAPREVASDYKPPPTITSPPPSAKPAPKKEPEPRPTPAARSAPPTMSEQKGSIAAMASKFTDHDEDAEEDDDDDSSFEEVSRPAQRGPRGSSPARATPADELKASYGVVRATPASELKASYGVRSQASSRPAPQESTPVARSTPPAAASTPPPAVTSPPPGSSSSSSVEASLGQIMKLLESQSKTIQEQNQKISQLAADVETLKKKAGSGSQDQSERIRQLELELEAARS
jgi:coronin-1B/1C/6